jgi:hypothetical protein
VFIINKKSAIKSFEYNFNKFYNTSKTHKPNTYNPRTITYDVYLHSISYFDFIIDCIDLSISASRGFGRAIRTSHIHKDIFENFIKFIPKSIHHEIFLSHLDDSSYERALVLPKLRFDFVFKIVKLLGSIFGKKDLLIKPLDPYVYSSY